MKTWKAWTTKELATLDQLRTEGVTAKEIARRLGRTIGSVKCRLSSEGITRVWRLATVWLPLLGTTHRIADIAKQAGTTVWAVKQAKRKLRRAGFEIPNSTRGNHGEDADD